MNILIVHNYYRLPGGEDTVVANEKKLLEEHGDKVVLYIRGNSEINKMSILKKLMLPFCAVFNIRTYRDIKSIIKENNIDAVHVHNTLTLISPSVYYAALSCGIPVIQTVHNFRLLCPNAIFYRNGKICEDCVKNNLLCALKHRCYRKSFLQTLICVIATKIHRITEIYGRINYICLTDFNKNKLLTLKQIKPERVFIKPNFVNQNHKAISTDEKGNYFIYVGRLDKMKGTDILLKAWNLLGSNAPRLIICGAGPMEDWCRDYIAKNRINAEMLGLVQNSEALGLIARSKALILPTQLYEGLPMTIVEAFSTGTPVICSDIGNAGDIVKDGITGLKFQHDSAEALEDVIRNFDACNKKLGENAYLKFCKNFSAESNYISLMNIYKAVKTL